MPQPVLEEGLNTATNNEETPTSNNTNETVTTIGNFDVLLEEESTSLLLQGRQHPLRLRTQNQHVGNNRFQVLVTMHKKEYESKARSGENTRPIVERIISIVCKQVKPNGRFLLYQRSTAAWTVLTNDQVADFIGSQLDQAINLTHRGRVGGGGGSTLDRRATMATTPQPVSLPHLHVDAGHAPPSQQQQQPYNNNNMSMLEPTPLPFNSTSNNNDDSKKRRRRSSLLRRSMSESVLTLNDKKKNLRQHSMLFQGDDVANAALAAAAALAEEEDMAAQQEQQQQQQARPDNNNNNNNKANLTTTAEALDVIFTASANRPNTSSHRRTLAVVGGGGSSGGPSSSNNFNWNNSNMLVPSHTGNNRLFVLMNVQIERYMAASTGKNRNEQERVSIVEGLKETVGKHWGGRFLQETQDLTYRLLSPTEASELLMKALDERAGVPTPAPSSSGLTAMDTAPASSTGGSSNYMAAAAATGLDSSLSSINSASSTGSMRRPSHVKRETLSALHGVGAGDHLRKTALDSLQQKKKRMGITSRLAALTRSTSEPIRNIDAKTTTAAATTMMGEGFSGLSGSGPGGGGNANVFPPAPPPPPPPSGFGSRAESAPVPRGIMMAASSSSSSRPPPPASSTQRPLPSIRDGRGSSTSFSPLKHRYSVRGSLAGFSEMSEGQINDLLSTLEVGDASGELATESSSSPAVAAAAATSGQQPQPQQPLPTTPSRVITTASSSDSLTSPFLDKRASVALSELTDGQVKDLLATLDVTDDDDNHAAVSSSSGANPPASSSL